MTAVDPLSDLAGEGALPYDPAEGTPLPTFVVDDTTCIGVMSVGHLLQAVPDPIASEKPERIAEDPRLKRYGELRGEVQRLVEGAKAKNAKGYAEYLVEGYRGERPSITPPITLYHPDPLKVVDLAPGVRAVLLPYASFLTAIDGETQRIALGYAAQMEPRILDKRVAFVLHHGKDERVARQGFYDLNTREVKPNAAVAISMDSQDPATKITRLLAEQCEVIRGRVNMRRRQLRKRDADMVTISALRTGVVTTLLGEPGLQVGSRPVALPDKIQFEELEAAVFRAWAPILDVLEDDLAPERRPEVLVCAPSILAGIGVLAHRTLPSPPRRKETSSLTIEEVVERLDGVRWERQLEDEDGNPVSPWDGIAGKFTLGGRFSVGGPKEVGYAVAKALQEPDSPEGRQIRGR
jgi:DNA sulfur modification protein DndB